MSTVWVVIKSAGYDHGVYFVGASEAEAQAFCEEWAPDRDGHHEWRVEQLTVGVPVADGSDGYNSVTLRANVPAKPKPTYRPSGPTLGDVHLAGMYEGDGGGKVLMKTVTPEDVERGRIDWTDATEVESVPLGSGQIAVELPNGSGGITSQGWTITP